MRFKRKKPRTTSKAGIAPVVYWTMRGARDATEISELWPKRARDGRKLFLLHACDVMREVVQRLAPEINGVNWSQELEIVVVNGPVEDFSDTAAVIHPGQTGTVGGGEEDEGVNKILYIGVKGTSPAYVRTLRSYNPWPAGLLPVKLTPRQARVVSRSVSMSEVRKFESRIMSNQRRIEADLKRNGLSDADLTQKNKGEGTEVLNDLAFQSLRFEFGVNEKLVQHWRPALKAVESAFNDLGKRYVKYIETGKESVFTVPQHGTISTSDLSGIDDFSQLIIRSSGVS